MGNLYQNYRVMAAHVKVIVFNTGLTPIRVSMGPSTGVAPVGSNAVDTLALNRKGVTEDVPFGYNNKKVIQSFLLVSDAAALDTVTETTFQRLYQWVAFTSNPPESFYA
jgi:hypothetical protein